MNTVRASRRGKYTKYTVQFAKGEKINLDTIYSIQGLAGGNWWEKVGDDMSNELVVTRSIKITIIKEELGP